VTGTDAPWLRSLRTEVRARLRARHVTQASLAAYLGVTPHHVNQVLTGKVTGSPDLLSRMAEAMGLRIAIVTAGREPVWLAGDKRPWLSGNRTLRGKVSSPP
jgi:transcriptional regulator with XRE-family HTH domain